MSINGTDPLFQDPDTLPAERYAAMEWYSRARRMQGLAYDPNLPEGMVFSGGVYSCDAVMYGLAGDPKIERPDQLYDAWQSYRNPADRATRSVTGFALERNFPGHLTLLRRIREFMNRPRQPRMPALIQELKQSCAYPSGWLFETAIHDVVRVDGACYPMWDITINPPLPGSEFVRTDSHGILKDSIRGAVGPTWIIDGAAPPAEKLVPGARIVCSWDGVHRRFPFPGYAWCLSSEYKGRGDLVTVITDHNRRLDGEPDAEQG